MGLVGTGAFNRRVTLEIGNTTDDVVSYSARLQGRETNYIQQIKLGSCMRGFYTPYTACSLS